VERGHAPPELVLGAVAAEAVPAASDQVPQGVAAQCIACQADDVDDHDEVAQAEVEAAPIDERVDGVVAEDRSLHEDQVEGKAVQVVENPKARLAAVRPAVWFGDRARPRMPEIAAKDRLPVVVT